MTFATETFEETFIGLITTGRTSPPVDRYGEYGAMGRMDPIQIAMLKNFDDEDPNFDPGWYED